MAEKFDEFSKHVAKRHSRRGLFKFFGAGVLGAFTATIFTRNRPAEADGNPIRSLFQTFLINQAIPTLREHQQPRFNATIPEELRNPTPWWERFFTTNR